MKKLFFSLAFLFFSLYAQAQNLKGEVFIGINGTQIDGDNLFGYHKPGLMLGVGTYFEFADQFSLHISGIFNQKGAQSPINKNNNNQFKQRLNYIDFPVFLEFNPWQELFLSAGITPGYLVNAVSLTNGVKYTNTDEMNRVSVDWAFGAKYNVADNVGLGVRFSYSLNAVRNSGMWRNNLLSLYSSFYF